MAALGINQAGTTGQGSVNEPMQGGEPMQVGQNPQGQSGENPAGGK
jgi:hypothetical protein